MQGSSSDHSQKMLLPWSKGWVNCRMESRGSEAKKMTSKAIGSCYRASAAGKFNDVDGKIAKQFGVSTRYF